MKHSVHQSGEGPAPTGRARGRPPATSAGAIAATALRLFAERGYEETTLDDIAAAVGIARRTLFGYYRSKGAIVWDGQRLAGEAVLTALERVPADVPWRTALVEELPRALRYPDDDLDLLRRRLRLIVATPALRAHLAAEEDSPVDAVAAFIAAREPADADGLTAHVVARAVLAALTAALTWWAGSEQPDPRAAVHRALRDLLGAPRG